LIFHQNILSLNVKKIYNESKRKYFDNIITQYFTLDNSIQNLTANDPSKAYKECVKLLQLISDNLHNYPPLLYKHMFDLAQCSMLLFQRQNYIKQLKMTIEYQRLTYGKDIAIDEQIISMIALFPDEIKKEFYKYGISNNFDNITQNKT